MTLIRPLRLATLALAVTLGTASAVQAANDQVRKLPGFTSVNLSGAISMDATVKPGPSSLRVSADPSIMGRVVTEVKGSTLHVYLKKSDDGRFHITDLWRQSREGAVKLTVTAPKLDAMIMSGACHAHVKGLTGEGLRVTLSGASSVDASGKIGMLYAELSGACSLKAVGLKAQNGDLSLSGASSADVDVAKTLKVNASGACSVSYRGKPSVAADVSGMSTVHAD